MLAGILTTTLIEDTSSSHPPETAGIGKNRLIGRGNLETRKCLSHRQIEESGSTANQQYDVGTGVFFAERFP